MLDVKASSASEKKRAARCTLLENVAELERLKVRLLENATGLTIGKLTDVEEHHIEQDMRDLRIRAFRLATTIEKRPLWEMTETSFARWYYQRILFSDKLKHPPSLSQTLP
jgi:hypothetical protein